MAGYQILTPSAGSTDWTSADTQREKQRKGFLSMSLSNWDTTGAPAINAGSVVEMGGSLFQFASTEAIGGTFTTSNPNYIYLTSSSSSLTASATSTAPTWSIAKQGFYDAGGTKRCVGGCCRNRNFKWIYTNRNAGPFTRHIHLPFAGHTEDLTNITLEGAFMNAVAPAAVDEAFFDVGFPSHSRCIVKELATYCSAYSDGTHTLKLLRSVQNSGNATTMAATAHTATGEQTDTTITDPIIDIETNQYFVKYDPDANATGTISSIRIEFTEIVRC